ncbi:MAG: FkbM family methyltransferase [Thiohalocapsa sp.]
MSSGAVAAPILRLHDDADINRGMATVAQRLAAEFGVREFLIRRLRRAPVIRELWDQYERLEAAHDKALGEREAVLARLDATIAERDALLAGRSPRESSQAARRSDYPTALYAMWGYRLLLGREPENAQVLDTYCSRTDIVGRLIGSAEFAAQEIIDPAEAQAQMGPRNVFRDPVAIPYHGCEFVISKWADLARDLASPEGYEGWVLPYFLDKCRDGMTVLDVGASWGVYALPAAKRVRPNGRVFAVEVSPQNCRVLLHNAKHNGLDNVQILAVGASDRVGTAWLPIQTRSNTNSIVPNIPDNGFEWFSAESEIVPTLPLDLLRPHIGRVDVMKMDIDGTEYRACLGASELLAACRPTVFLEYCPSLLRVLSGIEPGQLLKLFLDMGYAIEVLHRARPREAMTGMSDSEVIARVDRLCEEHVGEGGTHLDLCMLPNGSRPAEGPTV